MANTLTVAACTSGSTLIGDSPMLCFTDSKYRLGAFIMTTGTRPIASYNQIFGWFFVVIVILCHYILGYYPNAKRQKYYKNL
jgi:hypothetical protein